MKNKKENEELQSRREFFKNAAKKALPIIGAIALTSSPIIAQAARKETISLGCDGCTGLCTGCTGCTSCQGFCEGSCTGCTSCQGRCSGSCTGCTGCSANCYGQQR